jgi:hypothetical protein
MNTDSYHMQYKHGISPRTHLPFSPPTAFRSVGRIPKNAQERAHMDEGHCHACKKWVPLESVKKEVELKVHPGRSRS